ncbi:hypothetical protein, partial [Escherichia coli]|uniref:hypothetical protein n=1 Tax=Escherichia coli TaxID=562 RepID=UPI0035D44C90
NYIKLDDEDYIEFVFDQGSVVIAALNLVRRATFIYRVYSEIIAKGHVPWFMSYEDLGRIFESAPKHAGVGVGANFAIVEMIIAAISRLSNDRTMFYRHALKLE